MSSITIRNLPEGVKESLAVRARETGESLEAYLRRLLQAEAAKSPPPTDWASFLYDFVEQRHALPPLKPGQKDFYELIEEISARDLPLSRQ